MKPAQVIKRVRNLRNAISININRARGREFIPNHRSSLAIETSSVCNLACRFCAYPKKTSPKVVMKDAFFKDCVRQALEMGYRKFPLTPCTGDIFMDRGIFNKFKFLDETSAVESYDFFTNFTVLKAHDIRRLLDLGKLTGLNITIYGCDAESFVAITQSTEKLYRRLVYNLETLLTEIGRRRFHLQFWVHAGVPSLRGRSSEITQLMERFREIGIPVKIKSGLYNNWGGLVTTNDVRGLPIDIAGPGLIYKKGACVELMTTVQVMATGIVNGCACRDTNATLRLGDLNEVPLRDLISSRNPRYMALIEQQQQGRFQTVCQSCDMYNSIYLNKSKYRGTAVETLDEFKRRIG